MSVSVLDVREGFPDLPSSAESWLATLDGPTVVLVPGHDRDRLRVVSGLLHGNEPSGLRAIFEVLRRRETPATDVLFFLGGVEAARIPPGLAHRMVPGRRDLNRCFRAPFDDVDGAICASALRLMERADLEAVVDLHNNTGHNPAYAVGATAEPTRLGLASYFGDRFVSSFFAFGALHEVFPAQIPAVAIECGRAGDPKADAVAVSGLRAFLEADVLRRAERSAFRVVLGHPVRVCLRPDVSVHFGDHLETDADLTLAIDIDRHNFELVPPGTRIGWVRSAGWCPVQASGEGGTDVTADLFRVRDNELVTRVPTIPIMMTTSAAAAAADCLFYIVREAAHATDLR